MSEARPPLAATVTFLGEIGGDMPVPVQPGMNLLETAIAAGIPIFHDCHGNARCTTCRVRIVEGELPMRTEEEAEIARMSNLPDDIRLACQLRAHKNLRVERMMRQELQRGKNAAAPADERSEELPLAVLFCDINDFTEFAAERMPYDVVHVVNRFFLRIGDAVLANSGHIDKYLGDGLLALWGIDGGTPRELVLAAIRAGLLMQHSVRELSAHLLPHFGADLSIRVGIHFGPAIVGRIGHPVQQHLTAIGDTVNVAARVEAQNKQLRTSLLITEECYQQVSDLVIVGDDFKTVLRGQGKPQRLYEITGLANPDPIFLVQQQIHRVLVDGHKFVERFYHHFFTRAPEVQTLFKDTVVARQHDLFMNQLAWAVRELRHLSVFRKKLGELGERHRLYGVRPEYFSVASDSLLAALEETLGSDFDSRSRAAWTQAIASLAAAMQGRMS